MTNPAPPAKHLDDLYDNSTVNPTYHAKAKVLNAAIQDIGMGRYQYYLFICAGFGCDSVWPLITALILPPVIAEFSFNGPFLSLVANIGFLVGAIIWGLGSDVWGRKWSFSLTCQTLLIAGVFGLAAGGSPNFLTLASLLAVVGVGVGGNLPIDSAVFLDLVPASHQYLLTVMSVFWSLGQLLLAWPLIANFSCSSSASACSKADNMGWRYLLFILGALTLILSMIRFFAFNLLESPRFLIGIGADQAAVDVIHQMAAYNSTTTTLSLEDLTRVEEKRVNEAEKDMRPLVCKTSIFTMTHIKALFATRKMAISTSMLMTLWAIIGLAATLYNSFLPFFQIVSGSRAGVLNLMMDSYISPIGTKLSSASSVSPDPFSPVLLWSFLISDGRGLWQSPQASSSLFFGGYVIQRPLAKIRANWGLSFREHNLSKLYTAARVELWLRFLQYCMNHYTGSAISPEIFPAKDRGTGNALVGTATRVFGVIAPVIALYANLSTAVPVYISGALIMGAGFLALFLPFEPRGKASM
ncbi:major facilitator superfamily domain-containing protein [Mycena capillaripes]|nr:major facilitator superfamily domain-containing protein [Mycena capillaripes]